MIKITQKNIKAINNVFEENSEKLLNVSIELNDFHQYEKEIDLLFKQYGTSICELKLMNQENRYNISHIDFIKTFPELKSLEASRCVVNETLFVHENVSYLKLKKLRIHSSEILSIESINLKEIDLEGVNWKSKDGDEQKTAIYFTPNTSIESFSYHLDEDDAESYPALFVFNGCKLLKHCSINISGVWTVKFSGELNALNKIYMGSQRYGFHTINTSELESVKNVSLQNIINGKGPCLNEKYLFDSEVIGYNRDEVEKLNYLITFLNGKVVNSADENPTHIIVTEDDLYNYDDGVYSDFIQDVKNHISDFEVISIELLIDSISNWY